MDLKTIGTVLVLTVPFFFLTIWALVDCLQKDFGSIGKKAVWGLIAAVPFVGAIVYFIFGFRKGKRI
ncbi:MAG: PLDc N-terminal domain-containing protein [Deltaproteobacteria bacterium]|nr:PLDc N-terminal domain-containing protein [Deltaproteobacteria bacterium]